VAAALQATEGHAVLQAANKQMQAAGLKEAKQKQAATLQAAYEEHGKRNRQCGDAFTRDNTTRTGPAEEPTLEKCLGCEKSKRNEDLCQAGECRECCLGMSCWDDHIQRTPATSEEDRLAPCTPPCTAKAAAPVPAAAAAQAGGCHAKAEAIAAEAGADTDAEANSMAWHSAGTLANCSSGGSDDWDLRKMGAAARAKQSRLATAKPRKIRKTEQKKPIHTERQLDHLALAGILRRQSRLDRSAIQRSIQSSVATEKLEAGVHDLTHLPDGANAAAQIPIPPTTEAANAQVGGATGNIDAEAVAAAAGGGGRGSPASSDDKTPIASPSSSEQDDAAYAAKHPYHEQWHLPSEKLKLQQFRGALPTCCIDQATPQGGWVKPLETRLQQCSCHCCFFNNAKQCRHYAGAVFDKQGHVAERALCLRCSRSARQNVEVAIPIEYGYCYDDDFDDDGSFIEHTGDIGRGERLSVMSELFGNGSQW
jgi:hypothetical protein